MIAVMVSKWVGDAFRKEGIYSRWIALRQYPWLPYTDYRDKGETATGIMIPFDSLVTITSQGCTIRDLGMFLLYVVLHIIRCSVLNCMCLMSSCISFLAQIIKDYDYHGYPVVGSDKELIGYVIRNNLKSTLSKFIDSSINMLILISMMVMKARSRKPS